MKNSILMMAFYHSEGITAYCNELKAASGVFKEARLYKWWLYFAYVVLVLFKNR
jgi:hypothetical protein